jgi:hypothetical protein
MNATVVCELPGYPCLESRRPNIYDAARTCKTISKHQCTTAKNKDSKLTKRHCVATRKAVSRLRKSQLCSYIVRHPSYRFKGQLAAKELAKTPVAEIMNSEFLTPIALNDVARTGNMPDYARMLYLLRFASEAATLFHIPGELFGSKFKWTNVDDETDDIYETPTLQVPDEFTGFLKRHKKARYVFALLNLVTYVEADNDTSRHANYLMFDMQKKTISRFEPSGYGLYDVFDMDDLDDALRDLGKNLKGWRYVPPFESCPRQLIGKLAQMQRKARGEEKRQTDPGGFCKIWSTFMLEQQLRNLDTDVVVLHDRFVKYFMDNAIDLSEFARKYTARVLFVADEILKQHGYTGGDKRAYMEAHWDSLAALAKKMRS